MAHEPNTFMATLKGLLHPPGVAGLRSTLAIPADEQVRSVTLGQVDGHDVIMSGTDKEVRLWDPQGHLVGEPIEGNAYFWATDVAVGNLDGQDVILTADDDTLQLWDAQGHPLGEPIDGAQEPAAFGHLEGQDVVVSRALRDGWSIVVWDVDGQPILRIPTEGFDVNTLVIGRLNGQDVIASGDLDGVIRIWDAAGELIAQTDPPDDAYVAALAIGRLGGADVIAASTDGGISLWDAAGQLIRTFAYDSGIQVSLAIGQLLGQDVLVSGGTEGVVVWDAGGRRIAHPTDDLVYSVAIGHLQGREVIASGGDNPAVRIWATVSPGDTGDPGDPGNSSDAPAAWHPGTTTDPWHPGHTDDPAHPGTTDDPAHPGTTDDPAHPGHTDDPARPGHTTGPGDPGDSATIHLTMVQEIPTDGDVTSVALGHLDGRDVIVSASAHAAQIWDAQGHALWEPLPAVPHYFGLAAAIGRMGVRDVVACVDVAGVAWDAAGNRLGDPLEDATGPVAIGQLGGKAVIVSGGPDSTVLIWDETGRTLAEPLAGHTDDVSAVAIGWLNGQEVIVSGDEEGVVRIWDAHGKPFGQPITAHTDQVSSLALGRWNGRDVIVSGSWDKTVGIWDPAGHPVGRLTGADYSVYSVAIGQLGDQAVIVAAGIDGVLLWDTIGKHHATLSSEIAYAVAVGRLGGDQVVVAAQQAQIQVWGRPNR